MPAPTRGLSSRLRSGQSPTQRHEVRSKGLGLSAEAPEGASNLPMPIILLPFLGSGFVPATSMSPGLRQFAEYQPFTPITETLRGLLLGTQSGADGFSRWAGAWC